MGRRSSDPTMVGTSIALLQERFRQLQKDKQRREKKELLLNLWSDSSLINASTMSFEARNSSAPRDEDSLSLCLNLQNVGKRAHVHEAGTMPSSAKLWPGNTAVAGASRNFDNPDVDTTLHL